jgi:hypothetical protein
MLPKLPEFPWYQRDPSMEDVEEYGRQCWNAAIEAALDVYYDYDSGGEQDNTDVAIRALTLDTVSPTE